MRELHGTLTPGRVARVALERYEDRAWLAPTGAALAQLYREHVGAADRMAESILVLGGLMRSVMPAFSVVIATKDRAHSSSVRSLVRRQSGAPPFEVVVVDNGSIDATRAIVERLARSQSTRSTTSASRSPIAAKRAIAASRRRTPVIIVFCDDDVGVTAGMDRRARRGTRAARNASSTARS